MLRFFVLFTFIGFNIFSSNKLIYNDPIPESKYVNTNNRIILGFEKPVNCTLQEISGSIKVNGNGKYYSEFSITRTGDHKKIIISPACEFEPGTEITVTINGRLLKEINATEREYKYSFYTSAQKIYVDPAQSIINETQSINMYGRSNYNNQLFELPSLTVSVDNNPSQGYLFLSNFPTENLTPYLIITDNNGVPFYYKEQNYLCADFKKQPNGNLTYYNAGKGRFYEMNPDFQIIDSFYCGNGYTTDTHELRMINNGHSFLMSYDPQVVNMSLIIPGGDPAAVVTGLIIQELDENRNVIFQWRSWDHFAITDAWHENLRLHNIDYVHGNALEIDNDGNLLLSSRHMDEITKIDINTGNIIWRWGGKNNQFTFINDTLKFTYQHAIRRISNGNVTLYDNGNFHTPQFSRAAEYTLDEVNKTCRLVWQYRNNPDIFGGAMGYVERMSNGNTLISWGSTNPTVTEVDSNKNIVFQMSLPEGNWSYRVLKTSWEGPPLSTHSNNINLPAVFNLKQNYPNPFNPETIISFDIPIASSAVLTVFDITGRILKDYKYSMLTPGSYNINFKGSNYGSGVYFYKLTAGNFSGTKKMILLK